MDNTLFFVVAKVHIFQVFLNLCYTHLLRLGLMQILSTCLAKIFIANHFLFFKIILKQYI